MTIKKLHYPRLNIGISSCLLGREVRYDGGHKRDSYIANTLARYFDFIPICPEVGIGMPVPRPPIHLVREGEAIRALDVGTHTIDYTDRLDNYHSKISHEIESLCGYILKKDSPSCGMDRVNVFQAEDSNVPPQKDGMGRFAHSLMTQLPLLPLVDESRIRNPQLRENFIQRVYVYYRWRQVSGGRMKPRDLVDFHSDHKYLIMAHDQVMLRKLGQIVARAGSRDFDLLKQNYIRLLMQVLRKPATRRQYANVLFHLSGYLRHYVGSEDRKYITQTIQQYQRGYVPLIVVIKLMKNQFRKYPLPYMQRQVFLNPHPVELKLSSN